MADITVCSLAGISDRLWVMAEETLLQQQVAAAKAAWDASTAAALGKCLPLLQDLQFGDPDGAYAEHVFGGKPFHPAAAARVVHELVDRQLAHDRERGDDGTSYDASLLLAFVIKTAASFAELQSNKSQSRSQTDDFSDDFQVAATSHIAQRTSAQSTTGGTGSQAALGNATNRVGMAGGAAGAQAPVATQMHVAAVPSASDPVHGLVHEDAEPSAMSK